MNLAGPDHAGASTGRRPRLLHAFPTFEAGGAQVRFIQLANAFGPAFHHLIVAMDGNFSAAPRLRGEVSWEAVPLVNQRGASLANRASFRAQLKRLQPDLLLSYNWGAIEWMAANVPALVPQVHVEDGFRPDELQRQLPRRLWTRRALYALSNARLVVPSQRLHHVARSWWVAPSRCAFVPNGVVCPAQIQPRPAPVPGAPLVIGTVAALRAEKNIPRLMRAVAALRGQHDLRLLIVGDGLERQALERLASSLGLDDVCEFTGYLADPSTAWARIDLFALSSDTEQLPMALLEAMASGVPAVATAVGDVPHLMPAMAPGALAEPDDAAFLLALAWALDQREAWPAWAAAGLALVRQQYDIEQMLRDWRVVFNGGWPGPA